MKKKKLVVFILVMVMVLSLALTALVGCDKDKDKTQEEKPQPSGNQPVEDVAPEGYKLLTGDLTDALEAALENSAKGNLVNSLKASAQLTVGAKYGDSTSKYVVKFGANAALKDATSESAFGLSIVDANANNANILNAYYLEDFDNKTGYLYVDLGSGDTAKHFAINALSLKAVLNDQIKEGFPITDDAAGNISDQVVSGIEQAWDIIDLVAGFGHSYLANDNSEILFRLDLGEVLEKAAALLGIIDSYTADLGLALNSSNLASTLPDLVIDLKFGLKGAGDNVFTNAIFTGVKAELDVASKDLVVKRTDDSNFIRVNIAKDTELELGIDFAFGAEVKENYMPMPLVNGDDYKYINAIDFSAGGELTLGTALGATFKLNNKDYTIEIPAGTYTINVAVDLDPVQLIGMSFNASSTDALLSMIDQIVSKVVKNLSIDIADKANAADTSKQLKISIVNGKARLENLALLGTLGEAFKGFKDAYFDIGKILNVVKGFITETPSQPGSGDNNTPSGNGSGEGSGEAESGDKTAAILATVADIIKNLTIEANNGNLTVDLKNQVLAENTGKNLAGDNIANTTLDASVAASKDGLTIKANLKNIVTDRDNWNKDKQTNISATISANNEGVTIIAKSENLSLGGTELPIDLKIVFNKFELGNGSAAK